MCAIKDVASKQELTVSVHSVMTAQVIRLNRAHRPEQDAVIL